MENCFDNAARVWIKVKAQTCCFWAFTPTIIISDQLQEVLWLWDFDFIQAAALLYSFASIVVQSNFPSVCPPHLFAPAGSSVQASGDVWDRHQVLWRGVHSPDHYNNSTREMWVSSLSVCLSLSNCHTCMCKHMPTLKLDKMSLSFLFMQIFSVERNV